MPNKIYTWFLQILQISNLFRGAQDSMPSCPTVWDILMKIKYLSTDSILINQKVPARHLLHYVNSLDFALTDTGGTLRSDTYHLYQANLWKI